MLRVARNATVVCRFRSQFPWLKKRPTVRPLDRLSDLELPFRTSCPVFDASCLLTNFLVIYSGQTAVGESALDGILNYSNILSIFDNLTASEQEALYVQLGVSDREGILGILGHQKDTFRLDMHVKNYETDLIKIDEYWMHKQLLLFVPPIILIIGTIGNILSFIILTRKQMTGSTYIYLAVLSITDTLVLFIGLLRRWVGELNGHDVIDYSNWTCKTLSTLSYTVSDYSVWLIIAVTVERYIAVCWPLKAPTMCTKTRAIMVIVFILLLLIGLNLHFLWTAELGYFWYDNEKVPQCDGGEHYKMLVEEIWPWVDAFLYSFLPVVVISILNGLIIRKVISARKHRNEMSMSMQYRGQDGRRPPGEGGAKLTIMLLTISFSFLITTLPVNIALIVPAFWKSRARDLKEYSQFQLGRTIVELLMYTNHSINFFLYCATGQKFRQQLLNLCCRRKRPIHGYGTTITTMEATNGSSPRQCNGTRLHDLRTGLGAPKTQSGQTSPAKSFAYKKVRMQEEESAAL